MLPGLFYELPPKQPKPDFYSLTQDEYHALLRTASCAGPADKWLLDTFGGLSPLICRELAMNGWDGMPEAMDALYQRVRLRTWQPTMLLENGTPKDFSFMPLKQYGSVMESETADSFSALLDGFYARRDKLESLRRRGAELNRTAKTARDRLLRKLAARKQELKDTEKREEYRHCKPLFQTVKNIIKDAGKDDLEGYLALLEDAFPYMLRKQACEKTVVLRELQVLLADENIGAKTNRARLCFY